MTLVETATAASEAPCPGPIVTSPAHAARCRACGKCEAVVRMLNVRSAGGTLSPQAETFPRARLQS
jgi:hypothetical protein